MDPVILAILPSVSPYSQLYFILFEANLRECGNVDLISFIFACFGIFANTIYLHHSLHIRFKMFAQIRIQIFDLMQTNSCWSEYSLQSKYSIKIFEANKYSRHIRLYLLRTEYCGAPYTARKIPLMFSFLGIARPQSQFPHSSVCELFIYSQDRSTYFPAAE